MSLTPQAPIPAFPIEEPQGEAAKELKRRHVDLIAAAEQVRRLDQEHRDAERRVVAARDQRDVEARREGAGTGDSAGYAQAVAALEEAEAHLRDQPWSARTQGALSAQQLSLIHI